MSVSLLPILIGLFGAFFIVVPPQVFTVMMDEENACPIPRELAATIRYCRLPFT